MNHDHDQRGAGQTGQTGQTSFWRSLFAVGLLFFGAVSLYFLLSEHWAHFLDALPYVLLLSCPLMHVFMHNDHRGHGDGHGHRRDEYRGCASSAGPRRPTPEISHEPRRSS